mgnify:CR=1 FL=1
MENKCSMGSFITLLKQEIDKHMVEFKCGIERLFEHQRGPECRNKEPARGFFYKK